MTQIQNESSATGTLREVHRKKQYDQDYIDGFLQDCSISIANAL